MAVRLLLLFALAGAVAHAEELGEDPCATAWSRSQERGVRDRSEGLPPPLFPPRQKGLCEGIRERGYRDGYENAPHPWMSPRARQGRSLVLTGVAFSIIGTAFLVPGAVAVGLDQGCMGTACEGQGFASVYLFAGLPQALAGAILIAIGSVLWGRAPPFQIEEDQDPR